MKLTFARASQSQCDELHDLLTRAFTPYVQKLGNAQASGPYPWLKNRIATGDIYVCQNEEKIIGGMVTNRKDNELIIDLIGVDPACQGAGIGSWLLDQIELTARHDKLKSLGLNTAEIMPDLIRLYTRHGFVETRRALPDHGGDQHLRVHMKKLL